MRETKIRQAAAAAVNIVTRASVPVQEACTGTAVAGSNCPLRQFHLDVLSLRGSCWQGIKVVAAENNLNEYLIKLGGLMLLVLSNCKDGSFDAASKLIQHQTEGIKVVAAENNLNEYLIKLGGLMLLVLSNCKDGSFDAASKLIQHQTEWGRSPLDDELRSSHLYWTRRLRLPQLTVPSGAGCVSPIFGIVSVATWNQGQAEMMFESWFCIGFAIRSQKESSIEVVGNRDNTPFELNLDDSCELDLECFTLCEVKVKLWFKSRIDESQQRLGGSDLPEMGEFPYVSFDIMSEYVIRLCEPMCIWRN
uniref:Uncharacterized protein n=1 Tax=Ananas comosus var. bracteatus TaxID=296719 RepID=A0A6V7NT92_ANACO|nr:unnamed protein product [Ananas comosus var. bracteatus]